MDEKGNNHHAITVWFTGLPCSGKSTLATAIEVWIRNKGLSVVKLDGDDVRRRINKDLSFTDEDRHENIRRVAEICRLLNDAGVMVIASLVSPFIADRQMAKKIIGTEHFREVYIDADLGICKQRDVKGLYQQALTGAIKRFTGIDSPYEPPVCPDVHLKTNVDSIETCVQILTRYLTDKHLKTSSKS